jgi:protein-tyrosine-phosphatase
MSPGLVLFVCTHNSARSQFAAALWRLRTGHDAESAGTEPADRVHPLAMSVAADFDIDLTDARPKGYEAVARTPDLVVSVCDRAHEAGLPFSAPSLHWSVPDPVRPGKVEAFRSAFAELTERVDRLAASAAG